MRFNADIGPYQRQLAAVQATMDRVGRNMQNTGRTLTRAVTVPLVGVGVAAGKMAMDFEKSMSLIEGLVGVNSKQVDAWSKQILALGPKVGKGPKELADALYFITSSGIEAGDALDVLESSAKAATAGLGTTETVADAVTTAIGAYGMENLSAAQATDVLVAAVREGKGEADELAGVIGRVLPIAAQLGVRFGEVAGATTAMTLAGLDANEATTALRGIFVALIKPGAQANDTLASVGLSAEGLRMQLKEQGLLSMLMTLKERFNGNEEAMAKVFPEVRGLVGALNLLGQDAGATQAIIDRVTNSTGDMEAAFAAATDTAKFRFDSAVSELQGSMITLGNALLKYAIPAFESLVGAIGTMVDAFAGAPKPVQTLVLALAGIAAAVGPTLIVLGAMLRAWAAVGPVVMGAAGSLRAFLSLLLQVRSLRDFTTLMSMGLNPALLAVGATAAVGIAIWQRHAEAERKAQAATEDYTAILEAENGVLNENTRSAIANRLEKEGLLQQALQMGIPLSAVTDAVMGEAGAFDAINAKLRENNDRRVVLAGSGAQLTVQEERFLEALGLEVGAIDRANEALARKDEATDNVTGKVRTYNEILAGTPLGSWTYATEQADAATVSLGPHVKATGDAAAAAGGQAAEAAVSTEAMVDALNNSLDANKAAIDGARQWVDVLGVYNDRLAAKNEAEKAAAEATAESTKSQKDSWEDYFTEVEASFAEYLAALDQQIADQREYHANIDRIRRASGEWYAGYLTSLGPEYAGLVAKIADQSNAEIREGRDAEQKLRRDNARWTLNHLIDSGAIQVGKTGEISDEMVATLSERFGVSKDVIREIMESNKTILTNKLGDMKGIAKDGAGNIVDGMGNKLKLGVDEIVRITNQYGKALAAGLNPVILSVGGKKIVFPDAASARFAGRYSQRAEGGIDAHITRRPMVIYGEPETGGEAFIPLARAKRSRSRMIADETVRRLGGQITWMAQGGFASPGDVPKVPDMPFSGTVARTGTLAARYARDEAVNWLEENLAPPPSSVRGSTTGLYPPFLARFRRYEDALGIRFTIVSGFRTRAQQAALYAAKPGLAAPPGHSMHERGLALDLSPQLGNTSRGNPVAHRYGLTYPMSYEPWHIQWLRAGGIIADGVVAALAPLLADYRDVERANVPVRRFDSGGILAPGATLALNGTGAGELVTPMATGGITEALTGDIPRLQLRFDTAFRNVWNAELERMVDRWNTAWELGVTSARTRLQQLRLLMTRYLPWSDEWVAAFKERQAIVNGLLDEAIGKVEEAQRARDDAHDKLVGLLRQEQDLLETRKASLLGAYDISVRIERTWANSAAALISNTKAQTAAIAEQFAGLAQLRSRGLTEDVIAALGLEDLSAESAAQVAQLQRATDAELAALGDAWAARVALVDEQVAAEHRDGLGALGDDLAEIGAEHGMTYAEALAAALTSQVPAVAGAAVTLREAINQVGVAEKELTSVQRLATQEPAAGNAAKAPLARMYRLPDGHRAVRFSGPPATWALVGEKHWADARELWGPAIRHPDNRPLVHAGGRYVGDLLGPRWFSQYTVPNAAPKYFARGGVISKRSAFMAGEAGAERLTIQPLNRDMPTPTEKRREAHEQRLETMMAALVEAAREGREISIDGRVLSEIVSRRQNLHARGERVAAGRASWKTT